VATTVIMPKLGLTMKEGTIEKWLKREGDHVEKGEPLVEIITEKLNFQYESPASGILRKILHPEGKAVPVTTPIAIIAEEGEALPEFEEIKPEAPAEAPASLQPPGPKPKDRVNGLLPPRSPGKSPRKRGSISRR